MRIFIYEKRFSKRLKNIYGQGSIFTRGSWSYSNNLALFYYPLCWLAGRLTQPATRLDGYDDAPVTARRTLSMRRLTLSATQALTSRLFRMLRAAFSLPGVLARLRSCVPAGIAAAAGVTARAMQLTFKTPRRNPDGMTGEH